MLSWKGDFMKQLIVCLSFVLLAMDCRSDLQTDPNTEADTAAAKTAIQALAGALQTELKGAMQAGGPVAAIEVCNTQAMPITQKVASEQGLFLSRVSLKNRNSANLPNEWQTDVLEDFERQKAAGKAIDSLVWSETVNVNGEQEFRFMKAIPTGGICLACHGTALSPEVSQVLADLYPTDRATGYHEGDIRGAFVATRKSSN
jgi:hypothetical protein